LANEFVKGDPIGVVVRRKGVHTLMVGVVLSLPDGEAPMMMRGSYLRRGSDPEREFKAHPVHAFEKPRKLMEHAREITVLEGALEPKADQFPGLMGLLDDEDWFSPVVASQSPVPIQGAHASGLFPRPEVRHEKPSTRRDVVGRGRLARTGMRR
jgi:hypothetical protein